ncbi:ABC transporter substrate-binding protein [Brooklawnia cerclae]|uniref:Peptide/nickel transport system substrate-binding protein n=1 Tax=Brooklawnia cerclae TaxID=349934 RepID=A0ABX0SEF2_9ACTN|nr:ABC transporter substrate-binding protein [Brooklawnia cerclae]NIH56395.1 peptide/nickel transport system substrate-binding protein [Brooklawnia cerclae]
MKSTRARALASALISVLVIVLAGCGQSSTETADRQLVVGASVAPNSMDPSTSDAAAISQALLYNVYETLLKIDGDGQLQPLLASEWAVSPDGLTYTFTLRSQAKFSTGAPVNAEAVVTSVERIIDDDAVLPVLKTQMEVVDSVRAVDDTTVEFVLKHPSNNWLYSMAERAGIIYEPTSLADLATTPVGSGPFVFSEWVKGDSVVLTRNESYWGTETRLAGVTFKYYTDANALNAAMLSGSLDVLSNVAAPQALDQFEDSRFTVLEGTTTGEIVLGYNHQTPALQDLKVRQAINYAIDREALRDAVWAGKGPLIGSMVAPTDPWYEDLSGAYPYDPDKARELLAEAGIASGSLTLRLRVPTLPYATPAATYIASQLSEVGIQVQVDELEFPATWIDQVLQQSNYDMTIVAHVESRDISLWADPTYYWHYDNAEFQQLLVEADEASTQTEQTALMKQAAQILSDDAAADFLWLLPNLVVTKSDVTGVQANAPSLSFDMTAAVAPPQ